MDDLPCGVPFARQAAEERWRQLVKPAIRDKHGEVNSIAPEELNRLVTEYLEEHPEEALMEIFWFHLHNS